MITLTSELNTIEQLLQTNKYKYVYLSFGSKFNDLIVYFPTSTEPCNSMQQMYPTFMQQLDEKNICIIVDTFNSMQLSDNQGRLKEIQSNYTDFIIVNKYCDSSFTESLVSQVILSISEYNLPNHRFMIANYVRHLNEPNHNEKESECMFPTTIQNILNNSVFTNYKDCFYQWFGYKKSLYNYLYKYNNIQTNTTNSTLKQAENIIMNIDNINEYNQIVIQDQKLIYTLHQLYNFCEENYNKTTMHNSKLEYCELRNEIISPFKSGDLL